MSLRQSVRVIGAGALIASGLVVATTAPGASAEPCPDVEVVFARGTADAGRLGGADAPPERPSALDLLTRPLVGLSSLDLRRLRLRV